MQTAIEITSNLKNLRYYSDKIAELAKSQFQLDYDRGQEIGVNAGPGSIRFDCMEEIIAGCARISSNCEYVNTVLQNAISQDKVLHIEEEE